jgi:hypothetical protein
MTGYRAVFVVLAMSGIILNAWDILNWKFQIKKKLEARGWIKHQPIGFSVSWAPHWILFWKDLPYKWKIRGRVVRLASIIFYSFGFFAALLLPDKTGPASFGNLYRSYIIGVALMLLVMWIWRSWRSWDLAISKALWLRSSEGYKQVGEKYLFGSNWPAISTLSGISTTTSALLLAAAIGVLLWTNFASWQISFDLLALALVANFYMVKTYSNWEKHMFRGLAKPAAIEVGVHYLLGYTVLVAILFV